MWKTTISSATCIILVFFGGGLPENLNTFFWDFGCEIMHAFMYIFIYYVYDWSVHKICEPCTNQLYKKTRRWLWIPWTGVINHCEPLYRCGIPDWCPLLPIILFTWIVYKGWETVFLFLLCPKLIYICILFDLSKSKHIKKLIGKWRNV